jgi:hypothetical protein
MPIRNIERTSCGWVILSPASLQLPEASRQQQVSQFDRYIPDSNSDTWTARCTRLNAGRAVRHRRRLAFRTIHTLDERLVLETEIARIWSHVSRQMILPSSHIKANVSRKLRSWCGGWCWPSAYLRDLPSKPRRKGKIDWLGSLLPHHHIRRPLLYKL